VLGAPPLELVGSGLVVESSMDEVLSHAHTTFVMCGAPASASGSNSRRAPSRSIH
jgi:hypothetical protein